jgi:tetratricopeptide (TPR) repeat protein
MNQVLSEVDRLSTSKDPEAVKVHRAVEAVAVPFYREFLCEEEWARTLAWEEAAWAYIRLGNSDARSGRFASAIRNYKLAYSRIQYGSLNETVRNQDGQEVSTGVPVFGERPTLENDYRKALALCREGEPLEYATLLDYRSFRAQSLRDKRELARKSGRSEEADQLFSLEREVRRAISADHPQNHLQIETLLRELIRRSNELLVDGRTVEAVEIALETLKVYERVPNLESTPPPIGRAREPSDPEDHWAGLVDEGRKLATLLQTLDRLADADRAYCLVEATYARAPKGLGPDTLAGSSVRAMALFEHARLLERVGKSQDAKEKYRGAAAICEASGYNKLLPYCKTNLGIRLLEGGDPGGAIAEFREALRLKEDIPEAHFGLGSALRAEGQFADALISLRRAMDLLSKRLKAVSERTWVQLSADRYNAACAAALASYCAGVDPGKLTDDEPVRIRKLAFDWLRYDLNAWLTRLDKEPNQTLLVLGREMQHWLIDTDFTGLRGPDALDKLPEAERKDWQKLWDDVAETLARAQGKNPPEQKPGVR